MRYKNRQFYGFTLIWLYVANIQLPNWGFWLQELFNYVAFKFTDIITSRKNWNFIFEHRGKNVFRTLLGVWVSDVARYHGDEVEIFVTFF